MKTFLRFTIATAFLLVTEFACFAQHYNQTNLVSNASGAAAVADPQLINPWGLSRGSGSAWWVSDNVTGFSTLYDGAGAKQSLVVTIPPADPNNKKTPVVSPTGTIFDGKRYLYVANFGMGRLDVFDNAFKPVNLSQRQVDQNSSERGDGNSAQKSFMDEKLPNSYVPFNVQAIGNDIVVTYVLHEEGSPFESDGPGMGFVDIYNSTGELLVRLEHGDWLNAPWGVALASHASATTCSSHNSPAVETRSRVDSSPSMT